MEELAKLEVERGTEGYVQMNGRKGKDRGRETLGEKGSLTSMSGGGGNARERVASNEMCTFLILNISSL